MGVWIYIERLRPHVCFCTLWTWEIQKTHKQSKRGGWCPRHKRGYRCCCCLCGFSQDLNSGTADIGYHVFSFRILVGHWIYLVQRIVGKLLALGSRFGYFQEPYYYKVELYWVWCFVSMIWGSSWVSGAAYSFGKGFSGPKRRASSSQIPRFVLKYQKYKNVTCSVKFFFFKVIFLMEMGGCEL